MRQEIKLIRLVFKRRAAALELIRQQDIVATVEQRGPASLSHRQGLMEAQNRFDKASDDLKNFIEKM